MVVRRGSGGSRVPRADEGYSLPSVEDHDARDDFTVERLQVERRIGPHDIGGAL
jgi:hypothetical protein